MPTLIVESPKKAKTIGKFLPGWNVLASQGHIRDMPAKVGASAGYGIRPDGSIQYEIIRPDIVRRLQAATKDSDVVYLASDPDREGEAISWHLSQVLPGRRLARITFSEITEKAVLAALKAPRQIDMSLVRAQEGRRAIDRLAGYRISGRLAETSTDGVARSAGRVQSAALALVVRKQREIDQFLPRAHFVVEAGCQVEGQPAENFEAVWRFKEFLPRDSDESIEPIWTDRGRAEQVSRSRRLVVSECSDEERFESPPPPFTTSSLQQAASALLGISPEDAMAAAQALFEDGLITYHRTDSPNLGADAAEEVLKYLRDRGISGEVRSYKAKAGAQEAHGAIRPTSLDRKEAGEDANQKALYNLIRQRTLASCMPAARYRVRTMLLRSLDVVLDGRPVVFVARGQRLTSPGWRRLNAQVEEAEDDADGPRALVPELEVGTVVAAICSVKEKMTAPPRPYTEASLIRKLESEGIGRPSTYASILGLLKSKSFIEVVKKAVKPTQIAVGIIGALERAESSIVDLNFTRTMESTLDEIAGDSQTAHARYLALIRRTNEVLDAEVSKISVSGSVLSGNYECCGHPMRLIRGKNGPFLSCKNYPTCRSTKALSDEDSKRVGGRNSHVR